MVLKRTVAAAALVLTGTVAASAADLSPTYSPIAPPPPSPYVPAPAFDWSGPYVGAYGGYMFIAGFAQFGVQAGYNFMLGTNFLAGIEVQGGGIFAFPGLGAEGNLNARLGATFGNILVYGEAGVGVIWPVAYTWNAGGGVEYAINRNMSLFGEAKAVGGFGGGLLGVSAVGGVNWHIGN